MKVRVVDRLRLHRLKPVSRSAMGVESLPLVRLVDSGETRFSARDRKS